MNIAYWKHVATRLESLDQDECREALSLVKRVLEDPEKFDGVKQTFVVCHHLWGCVTRALDHGDFNEQDEAQVYALEAEMAGHVWIARLALGWVMRSSSAPVSEPTLAEIGL
ncbi:hypothetical protein RQP54_17730 [Curvibacter sp. APW13]|uniref:hypothetical protein n=1 Tax=Curvibacter sp. APW13 TaxID=3077236 RepID=UPI0028DFFA1B|nr:hypothetical protein [Curvibacter sp. APW13]MDT8992717.1 hypothetical protein [Curvibacter sp. APW13]